MVLLIAALIAAPEARPVTADVRPIRSWVYMNRFDAGTLTTLRERVGQIDAVSPVLFSVQANGDVTGADRADVKSISRAGGAMYLPLVRNEPRNAAFSPVLNDSSIRSKTVERLVRLVQEYGYDGLNIDFETILATDRPGLTAFVSELSAKLRPAGKLTTVAVVAKPRELTTGFGGAYDYAALGRASDYLVLMTYGYRTIEDKPGSTAPIDWVRRTAEFAASQTSPDKLLLGIGFWGYDWKVSGGAAVSRTHAEIEEFARRPGATAGYSAADESAWLKYRDGVDERVVWYEDSRAVTAKLAIVQQARLAGWAGWRLGQEGPSVWSALGVAETMPTRVAVSQQPVTVERLSTAADWPVPGGRLFSQAGGATAEGARAGYTVVDDSEASFWTEFSRYGGVDGLGYPISSRYVWNGFVTQAFQKAVLQWAPDRREANFVNVFDELSKAGKDTWLLEQRSTPLPLPGSFDEGRPWEQIMAVRLALLDADPAIRAAYRNRPDPMRAFGLPTSAVENKGNHTVVRLQRAVIQHWRQDVPWAKAGTVTIANGGDILAEAGLIPASARTPSPR